MVIQPKPWKKAETSDLQLRTIPCREDYAGSMLQLAEFLSDRSSLISVQENTVVLHPTALSKLVRKSSIDGPHIAELRVISQVGSTPSQASLVAVAESTCVAEDCVGKF